MEEEKLQETEQQEKIKIAKRLYSRNWRKKNKDKYLKNMDNFWLRQYHELAEVLENEEEISITE